MAKQSVLREAADAVAKIADKVDDVLPFAKIRHENLAKQPSFAAEMAAMWREFVNDVRGSLHEVFYGRPEHPQGMGVPLSPTAQLVTEALKGKGVDEITDMIVSDVSKSESTLSKVSGYAEAKAKVALENTGNVHGKDQAKEHEM